ncbi:MAG: lactate racemase domain-containing protein [Candidatus Zixiibacteriota bacterium]
MKTLLRRSPTSFERLPSRVPTAMDVKLTYAEDTISLTLPDWVDMQEYGVLSDGAPLSYDQFVESFERSGGERVLEGEPPLIIVNDGHRPTPTAQILDWLDQYDGRLLDNALFLIACGTHGEPSADHYRKIFGRHLDRLRDRLAWHDCGDLSRMTKIGCDRFGEPFYLNSRAFKARKILIITSVEPHYFAGFTGGRKSLFPGLTDRATIERNHNLANSLDCQPLRLKGNPMAEHLDELLEQFDSSKVFSIQVVADASRRILHAFCGPLQMAFEKAVAASFQLYAHTIPRPYDLVLAEVLPPLDRTLYQIQKGLENSQAGCADRGTVAVVASCRDGIGKRSFFDLAGSWDRETNQPRDGVPRFGSHKLSRVNAMTRRINVRLYSELPDDQPRRVFYEPVHDLETLTHECLNKNDRKRLAVVRDAGHTVLKLAGAP